jgi:MacB-like periplasmic core domain
MAKAQARKGVDFGESLKMATTTLIANKLRSGLTMLGIIIGNASVIAMVGIGQGTQNWPKISLKIWGQIRCLFCLVDQIANKTA